MKVNQIILDSANKKLKEQDQNGSMPAGYNGPYFDKETPVRNTGHWLVTFIKIYQQTGDERFLEASKKCCNFLLSAEARPYKKTFYHRKNKQKDLCNGLIGQAWTIEALSEAYKMLKNPELIETAKEVFLLHSLRKKEGLWEKCEIDGKNPGIDGTFNHQLWFAAAGSLLFQVSGDKKIKEKIDCFMNNLKKNFRIYNSGLIVHSLKKSGLKNNLKSIKKKIINKDNQKIINKAIGYHQFNLYAFAILKETYPDFNFWQSKKFNKALAFIESREYEKGLIDNKYGFDYNVAGIEVAFVLKTFKHNSEDLQKEWLEKQFRRNYDFKENMLSRNTADPKTLSARIYEATRLPDLNINL